MKFPVEVLKEEKNKGKLEKLLENELCLNCLGRQFGMLGHGLTNYERGKILTEFGESVGKKFSEPKICMLCNNFFRDKIDEVANKISKKLKTIEIATFLVGSVIPDEMSRRQDDLWETIGIEDVESIKAEINRELGKRIEKLAKKKFNLKTPDVTIVVDLNTGSIRLQVKSLYIHGKYQKLARGIPQTKWICSKCNGKGCTNCEGRGTLYQTSVQEIIEKPLLTATKSNSSSFHGSGREDIDARNLGWRPFIIEIVKPVKRKIDLKKLAQKINKSKKVKVKGLKFADKEAVRKIKSERIDKTYAVDVEFEEKIDKKLVKNLKTMLKDPIMQKTPTRVLHRRADKMRKRFVKSFSYKILGPRKMRFKVKGEAGLYIKELVTGDEGRTKPNVSELMGNKVKKLSLDVVKIWTGKG